MEGVGGRMPNVEKTLREKREMRLAQKLTELSKDQKNLK